MISRRDFVKASVIGTAGVALYGGPSLAFADESPQFVEFTPDRARAMGNNFISSMRSDDSVVVSDITPFYDEKNRLLGYIVTFAKAGLPHGYVIFDMSCNRLISEFCLDEGVVGVHEYSKARARSLSESHVVKIDPFRYAVIDDDTREGIDNYGSAVVIPDSPTTFNDLEPYLLESTAVFSNYAILEFGAIQQYCGYDQDYLMSLDPCGRYACSVAAAFTVASIYGACRAPLANDFASLWSLINPNGAGEANLGDVRYAVSQFCSWRGLTVAGEVSADKPSFSRIKGCINSNNVAVLAVGIGNSNHAVTVEGYGVIVGSGLRETQMVAVFDGWRSGARFMYFDLNWNYMNSAFFSGR